MDLIIRMRKQWKFLDNFPMLIVIDVVSLIADYIIDVLRIRLRNTLHICTRFNQNKFGSLNLGL